MDILEELRKQNEARHGGSEGTEDNGVQLDSYHHSVLLGKLRNIHDYLHELSGNLNRLQHSATVEMRITGHGSLSNLHQGNYELVWENRGHQNQVTLHFVTHINEDCHLDLDPAEIDEVTGLLNKSGVGFTLTTNRIDLTGPIKSSITFSVKPNDQYIGLCLSNFAQIGQQWYSLNERLISDDFFDQLGRYLLHRDNNLIELIASPTPETGELADLLDDTHDEQDSGYHTQEMDVSRVRSLFSREIQLYLTYHNTIKEISPKSGEFTLGRSRQCSFVINSDLASRQHAKIVYRKGKYVLIDQSTNGSFVKTQGGKEVYVQGEELPLSGSGFISLGKAVTVDNEHIIYFSCQ